jgi:hypothetical protein
VGGEREAMMKSRYMIRSTQSGEVYVSDGIYACGPLDDKVQERPLEDFDLDFPAPDWVAAREGKIMRVEQVRVITPFRMGFVTMDDPLLTGRELNDDGTEVV